MKKYFSREAIVSHGFPFKKGVPELRPVENDEIFDHLFIKKAPGKKYKSQRKPFSKRLPASHESP